MGPRADSSNPFSTRHVRPGAIPFFFPPGESPERLLARLAALGGRAQIVGPHGSGKSTLLAALAEGLRRCGRRALLIELHDGQRRLPPAALGAAEPGDLVMVDGYEQLSLWSRWRLRRHSRRRALELLVTAHRPIGLPTLWETSVDAPRARRVVDHLLGPGRSPITDQDLAAALARHPGDLREVLFDLYDLLEAREPPN